jgi:23S rRNA (adenine2503-C2)-methyltransferase
MGSIETKVSLNDASVNFVEVTDIGVIESRFVQRDPDYFITYLSSQTGCDQACRMCHLTATRQVSLRDTTHNEFMQQADQILKHHVNTNKGTKFYSNKMNYNFMARGEPLNNEILRNPETANKLLTELKFKALAVGAEPSFLISSIIPKSFADLEFENIFTNKDDLPYIYYSIYSMNKRFRKKWLGKALDPEASLEKLKRWWDYSNGNVIIHYCFIRGENDSVQDVVDVCRAINRHGINTRFNIVRYNPYSKKYGSESSEEVINRNAKIIENEMGIAPKIIPKVGFDVKASCGMFVE